MEFISTLELGNTSEMRHFLCSSILKKLNWQSCTGEVSHPSILHLFTCVWYIYLCICVVKIPFHCRVSLEFGDLVDICLLLTLQPHPSVPGAHKSLSPGGHADSGAEDLQWPLPLPHLHHPRVQQPPQRAEQGAGAQLDGHHSQHQPVSTDHSQRVLTLSRECLPSRDSAKVCWSSCSSRFALFCRPNLKKNPFGYCWRLNSV